MLFFYTLTWTKWLIKQMTKIRHGDRVDLQTAALLDPPVWSEAHDTFLNKRLETIRFNCMCILQNGNKPQQLLSYMYMLVVDQAL